MKKDRKALHFILWKLEAISSHLSSVNYRKRRRTPSFQRGGSVFATLSSEKGEQFVMVG